MINIFDLLKSLQAIVNPQQGGHIRPQQNYQRWLNEIQQELIEELVRQWEKNQVISDKLTPFLRSVNVALVPQPGKPYDIFLRPADYRYFSSARVLLSGEDATSGSACATCCTIDGATGKQVKFVDEDEVALNQQSAGSSDIEASVTKVDNMRWASALGHKIKKPTVKRPIITGFDGGFKIAPRGIGVVVMDYFRKPADAVFAYTLGPDEQIIFDPVASVNLEWDANMIPDFLARLEIRYGAYVREDFAYQAGQLHRTQVKV